MSVVLTIYSQSASKEFVLPAIRNAETVLVIDRNIFGIQDSLEIFLEKVDDKWLFLPSEEYQIQKNGESEEQELVDQANYILTSRYGEVLSIVVQVKESSFMSYQKYDLSQVNQVIVGNDTESTIYYSYSYNNAQYVSKRHCIIRKVINGYHLEDTSTNGVFVNDKRIIGSYSLKFGDRVHMWGLDMVFLGSILAVRETLHVKVNRNKLPLWCGKLEPVQEVVVESKKIYHRAPRSISVLETEPVEIEAPPAPKAQSEAPLWMTIGPAMTMTIPMLMSSMIAILGSRSTGVNASTYMYTGIITSVCSAMIGVFWALNNVRYGKIKIKKDENHRFQAYSEYLIKCTDEIKEKYNHNVQALNRMYPPVEECVSEEFEQQNLMWGRNRTHFDFLLHRLGVGNIPFQVDIQIPKERFTLINDSLADKPKFIRESYQTLHGVPVCLDLLKERVIGVVGGQDKVGAYPIVYTLAAQIAAQNCYTDVKMAFAFQEDQGEGKDKWEFTRWLPHTWSPDKKVRYVASDKSTGSDLFYELTKVLRFRNEEQTSSNKERIYKPHYVLFVEELSLLEGEPLEKYIFNEGKSLGLTVVLMAESYEKLPNGCECIVQNDRTFNGWYHVRTGERINVQFDVLDQNMLEQMARRMACIEVNENEVGGDVPNAITFFDMYGVSRLEDFRVEERWKKNRTYKNMKAQIGQKAGGVPCYLDVHEKYHGPHGLVAGTTGSGKSETLQTYMLSLALNFSPDDIGFFIIDYKGGGMANLFNGLPHILGQISNLSGNQVRRAMVSIKSENKRRQRMFNEQGVNNINAYTTLYKNGEVSVPIPHLFIIIDEFAELKREQEDFMKELISVAQVGRSLGVHLILATQKPAGTVDDNIWSNSKFRLCLRVQDRQDSMDMLHKADAAYLTQAGRAYLQVGNDEVYELFQSGWSGAEYDENEENSRKVIAKMLNDMGRTALVGSHVKRKLNEENKIAWLTKIMNYLDDGLDEWQFNQQNGLEIGDSCEEFLETSVFEMMREDNIDFTPGTSNSRALQNVIFLYQKAIKEGISDKRESAMFIIKNAAERGMKLPEIKGKTQLDAVVQYLAEVAKKEGYKKPQQLWLPVLPEKMGIESLSGYTDNIFDGNQWPQYMEKWELKVPVGLCDDPTNQAQMPLELNFTEFGHYAVCGMAMSGKSTFLQTVVFGLIHKYSPEYLNLYMLDFSSRMLEAFENEPHVGGVLYENDVETVGKFFYMLEKMVKERKELFKGGNYSQYVMTHGVTCPAVLVVIDNIANFREKTEFKFDDQLVLLARECAAYGIYFLISSAGFNTMEITSRLRDNIQQTICMEMTDKFAYGNCLNIMHLPVIPEPGIHGRGLATVNGVPLEFHTAVAVLADDDYQRGEAIGRECSKMSQAWTGHKAQAIPMIPKKPVWGQFVELDEVQKLFSDNRSLPFGYDLETASVYSIDLFKNYCYLISGKRQSGKTNMLRVLMHSAKMKNGNLVVVEFSSAELQKTATELEARYINSYDAYMEFILEFVPEFQKRNRLKKECLALDMENEEIYGRLSQEKPWFIFIADLPSYTMQMHGSQGMKDNVCGAMANLFDKGYLHNIFFFACMNQEQHAEVLGRDVYEKFIREKAGIHFGGNVAAQRLFDFNGMAYSEQSAVEKAGIGAVPPRDDEPYHKIVVPLMKGQQGS